MPDTTGGIVIGMRCGHGSVGQGMQSADCRRWCLQTLMLAERKRGFAATYPDAKAALGGDATKMVDLCLTMG